MAGRPASVIAPASWTRTGRAAVGFWSARCVERPAILDEATADLLALSAADDRTPVVGGRYPMIAVREAHQNLLARRITGSSSSTRGAAATSTLTNGAPPSPPSVRLAPR